MQRKPAKYNLHRLLSENRALRFSSANRPQEIFPILLDEIEALGFRKALVLEVDLTNGDIRPAASVNCSAGDLARFRTSLSAKENPLVSALERLRSIVLRDESGEHRPFYACPMIYRLAVCCREAEDGNQQNCLALKNFEQSRRFATQTQVCDVCGMRGYAAVVLAQAAGNAPERDRHALRALANRANQSLSQLFKIDHYFSQAYLGKDGVETGAAVDDLRAAEEIATWKKLEHLQIEQRLVEMEKFAATGRLAGTIAHEINNPLEAIKNAIHLLADQIPEESQPIFEVLKGETERVTRIVRQVLGLYRNVVQLSTFDVNSIVEDTLALFRGSLAKAHVKVVQKLGKLPPFRGASDQFRQLLSNLVVNSRDSMTSNGILTIHTKEIRSVDGSHRWISISLADTGTGVSPELRKSMFDAFVTSKGERGTGLGLWIAKGIVENHNGRISVRSTVGRGTLIRMMFPVSN